MGKKQVKFYIESELYERLARITREQGVSVPALVRGIVLGFLGRLRMGTWLAG